MLITDSEWTDPSGTMTLSPADQKNPAIAADAMFTVDAIPTYVVAIGEAMDKPFADELANAGGTGQAIDAMNPAQLNQALLSVADDIEQRRRRRLQRGLLA